MSPYLTKRGKKYSYRRRVPLDLIFAYHLPQIRFSLHTTSKREADRLAGKIDDRLDRVFADIRLNNIPLADARAMVADAIKLGVDISTEPTLKSVATEYLTVNGKSWSSKSVQEYWLSYSLAEDAIGNRIIRMVNRSACVAVRDHISKRGVSHRTVNKHMTRLTSWLNFSVETGIIQSNPCIGVLYKVTKKDTNRTKYLPFEDDEVRWILEEMLVHPGASRYCSYMYWMPIVGAFTGARSGDIAALEKGDIVERAGIKCFVLDNHKTGADPRHVPIHSQLIELGFLEFVDSIGDGQKLFNITKHRKDEDSEYDYKWFRRALRKKIDNPQKVFHSWRSTLSSRLNNAGVPSTHRADLLGHERTSDCETDKTYTDDTAILTLKEAIEKLQYPVDWERVKIK